MRHLRNGFMVKEPSTKQRLNFEQAPSLVNRIDEAMVERKLRKPVNFTSPSVCTLKDREDFLKHTSRRAVETISGGALESLVAFAANQRLPSPAWRAVGEQGKKIDLINVRTGKKIMMATQSTTKNHSSKLGDKEKATASGESDVEHVKFFASGSANQLKRLFGFSKQDTEDIFRYFTCDMIAAQERYTTLMRSNSRFPDVMSQLAIRLPSFSTH